MRRLFALALAGVLALALTACGSKPHRATGSDLNRVQERLNSAKANLDSTSAISFTLKTADLTASGYGTHPAGFSGTATNTLGSVKVVALGNKVWAYGAPLFQNWTVIDPTQFGFPNPAALMSTTTGLSTLLTTVTGLNTGEQTRNGHDIVTAFSGTVTGPAMQKVVSTADPKSTYQVTFKLTDSNQLVEAILTGPLVKNSPSATYDVTLSTCTNCAPISAPAP